eukprot:TRINITY_DN17539_c0_g1_i1.p1 TRINITY_DN17539_c0_g1~~TRINITY_DN17539_c0_g1_i1.p1  ORF type:complete len:326 (+),score=55.96 TRINITY_DN17539_c0_g1_i1:53-979(+)
MPPKRGKKKDDKKDDKKEVEVEPERPDGKKTILVGGWSQVQDMAQAVGLVTPDSENIIVMPGVYEDRIVLEDLPAGLEVQGENVVWSKGVEVGSKVAIKGITLKGDSVVGKSTGWAFLDCIFEDGNNLLTLHPGVDGTVKNCVFRKNVKSCVYCFPQAKGVVEGCTFQGDGGALTAGVTCDNSATKFHKNLFNTLATGAYIFCSVPPSSPSDPPATPTLSSCTFSSCTGTAVHIDKSATVVFKNNNVHASGYWGVTVSNGAAGTFTGNTITDKVRIREGCRPVLSKNQISERLLNENLKGTISMQECY